MNKIELKALFTLMCTSTDRTTSLGAYKAFRLEIRAHKIYARDVVSWLNAANITPDSVLIYKESGVYTHSVAVFLPMTYEVCPRHSLILDAPSYAGCLYKLAFKLIGYKWDMTLSQIHEVEAWSYPVVSRTSTDKN